MTSADPAVDDGAVPDGSATGDGASGGYGRSVRIASRTLGELLVTAGVILLLFVAYQLVWTNVQADRAMQAHTNELLHRWQTQPTAPEFDLPLKHGEPFALLRIPRLGANYHVPIIEGVTLTDLAEGVGHYPGTALPGQVGNFSVAGHRATNGEPFAELDQLRSGDPVVVETATTWYTYIVYSEQIVAPTQVDVILPVPGEPHATPTEKLLTLTTCNPRWASYERLIFHARLVEAKPKSDGRPNALAGG
ncbi:MAG TPA: class E sortase [Actinomycetes bacterium]|nr:class E sortase [Actinomycetes bacterium]